MERPGKLIELEPPVRETAVVVRLALPGDSDHKVEESLEEMRRLAWTAGADTACTIVQRRKSPCPRTYVGSGKVGEVKLACDETGADVVMVDADLSPRQGAALEDLLGRKVVDRTQLILDIFGQHAHTREGKHQVELAQLQYQLPRLSGRGSVMRQQGGIGVRGPGEQKLEVDRRVIRNRIKKLDRELDNIRNNRRIQRKKRLEGSAATVALVGYTNAGKSSLLNALSGSDVLVEDLLFATLDPRSRRCKLPSEREVVLTDTVGFIRELPHSLVAAFRATLEEVNDADLLLLVADASHPAVEDHIDAVYKVLDEIKASGKTILTVFNKIDAVDRGRVLQLQKGLIHTVAVSAHTGEGLDELLAQLDTLVASRRRRVQLRIPQSVAGLISRIHESGRVLHQAYEGNDIVVHAEIDGELERRLMEYVE